MKKYTSDLLLTKEAFEIHARKLREETAKQQAKIKKNTEELEAKALKQKIKQEAEESAKLQQEQEELRSNNFHLFLEEFEITNNKNDFVKSSDIIQWNIEKNNGTHMSKFSYIIKNYCTKRNFNNIMSKSKKIEGKTIQCWIAIKKK